MLHLPFPRTKLELQLKYRAINLNNQLKTNWREILKPQIYRRRHIGTGRKGGDVKRAGPTPTGRGWDSGGLAQPQRLPLKSVGSQPHARLPGPEHQSQKEAPPKHLAVKSSVSVCQGETESARDTGAHLKGLFKTHQMYLSCWMGWCFLFW